RLLPHQHAGPPPALDPPAAQGRAVLRPALRCPETGSRDTLRDPSPPVTTSYPRVSPTRPHTPKETHHDCDAGSDRRAVRPRPRRGRLPEAHPRTRPGAGQAHRLRRLPHGPPRARGRLARQAQAPAGPRPRG